MSQDEDLYLQATQEVDDEVIDAALWAKSMALAEGDTKIVKYKYIKLRVEQLKQRPKIEEEKRNRKQRIQSERIQKEESEIIAGLSELGCKMERHSFGGWKIREPLGGVVNVKTLEKAKEYYKKKKPAKMRDASQTVRPMIKNK